MLGVDRLLSLLSPAAALRRAIRMSELGKAADAFPLFAHAAKAGLAEAEHRVALCYFGGLGVPASRLEGVRWLERAASHGYVDAQVVLAGLCAQGLANLANDKTKGLAVHIFDQDETVDPDFESALKWARQASEAGSPKGQAILAFVLTRGPEHLRDLDAAHILYERSAEAGCPEGCLGYALSLAGRTSDEKGRRRVVEFLRHAAEAELPTAIYLLGVLIEQGVGVGRNPTIAVELFKRAAEKGLPAAQARWGAALMDGYCVEQDLGEAESWLRRAGLAGEAEAAARVGDLNARSGELPPNYAEAASWYRRAAEAGHKASARALASLHLTGAGVAQDKEVAMDWLRVAAEGGDQASQIDFANLVLQGEGQPEDQPKIAGFFEQAAASGDLSRRA